MMASPDAPRKFPKLLLLVVLGLAAGLVPAEILLRIAGYPRFYKAHSAPPQFAFLRTGPASADFVYVNTPSTRIRFVYDGNPRGYFGGGNEVDHSVNSAGFRGREFMAEKFPRTLRIACMGDSLTFGEGVHDEDTWPERLAADLRVLLAPRNATCECLNFGVGGYNTGQELFALREYALRTNPDVVVLGYTLNDPEYTLFALDPLSGKPVRRPREAGIPEGLDEPRPPDTLLYRLRAAQVVWKNRSARERAGRTVDYYRSLFEPSSAGWQNSRRALRAIIDECRRRGIPCFVIIFPILHEMNDDYPFLAAHEMVRQEVVPAGGVCVDLFPVLKGRPAPSLQVHPTDPHPNEIVHAEAARALAARVAETAAFQELVKPPGL